MQKIIHSEPFEDSVQQQSSRILSTLLGTDPYVDSVQIVLMWTLLLFIILLCCRMFFTCKRIVIPKRRIK